MNTCPTEIPNFLNNWSIYQWLYTHGAPIQKKYLSFWAINWIFSHYTLIHHLPKFHAINREEMISISTCAWPAGLVVNDPMKGSLGITNHVRNICHPSGTTLKHWCSPEIKNQEWQTWQFPIIDRKESMCIEDDESEELYIRLGAHLHYSISN